MSDSMKEKQPSLEKRGKCQKGSERVVEIKGLANKKKNIYIYIYIYIYP